MAKIPTILEAGRADGKLIKTNSIYDDNQEKFLSDKIKNIDDNHNNLKDEVNTLTEVINNNKSDIETKLETEKTRATNAESVLNNNIETEKTRATNAESVLNNNIGAETNRATTSEDNLRETINNITKINENATSANIVTIDTLPNSTASNVQQALNDLYENIIYDVSARNGGEIFESLSVLLSSSNLSTLIPTSVRHGGMSIRFVQSSDNKYVQYRLMSDTFNTTVANWQGVDNEPTAGSENIVNSGGVAKKIMPKFINAYIDTNIWKINKNHKSFYIFCHKGDIITISPNVERGREIIGFLSSIDTSVNPIFANSTGGAISIENTTDFVLIEDCYFLWITNLFGREDWSPSILELNHVSLLTEPYDQLVSSLNSLASINEIKERISFPLEINEVKGYYPKENGGWIIGKNHSCLYCQLKTGDIFSATGSSDYGSIIAFVKSVPNPPENLNFDDGSRSTIKISANTKYIRKVNSDCYVLWINYLVFGSSSQNWSPSEISINSINILKPNVFESIKEFEKVVSDLEYRVSDIDKQVSELETYDVNNLATYYQKGESPKTFDSNKKICIITAGQSNTEGRVPYADMPESIKNAQPIVDCQIVINSETAAFSSLNITNKWAFDLITYYNLVTRNNLSIYAIKWAKGGTSIDSLGDSKLHWTADYEELQSLSNSLLLNFEHEIRNHIASDGENFEIRAMLWHQGEGDRGSLGTGSADRYYKNLSNMIAYIRGIVGNKRLPFITGTISHNSAQYDAKIEAAQYQIASEDPYYYLIDMSRATLLDNYHFDAVSTKYFGEMAYDKLIDAGVISGTKINPIAPWET